MSIPTVQDEMNALKLLIDSKAPELLARLRPDAFANTELQKVFRLVGWWYAENGCFPGWDTLNAEVERRTPDPDKAAFMAGLLSDLKLRDTSGLSADLLCGTLETGRKHRLMLSRAGGFLDALEGKDPERALREIQQMFEEVCVDTSSHDIDQADMVHQAGQEVKFDFRKTGIEGIDRRGGLIIGGYTIIGAVAKAGKSILSVQAALHGHDHHQGSTAIFTYEQQRSEIRARILASRAELDIGLLMSGLLTPEDRLKARIAHVAHLCDFNENMRDFCHQTAETPNTEFWPLFWDHFEPRSNRCYLFDNGPNWDVLFTQMDLLAKTRNVKCFVIDYPFLVPRGNEDSRLASWEYNLLQSRKLKQFAARTKTCVIAPAQYDDKSDTLKFIKNAVNDCDLFIALSQEEGDSDIGEGGAVTASFKAYRNFLSIPNEPTLEPFKMLREFKYARFRYFNF